MDLETAVIVLRTMHDEYSVWLEKNQGKKTAKVDRTLIRRMACGVILDALTGDQEPPITATGGAS